VKFIPGVTPIPERNQTTDDKEYLNLAQVGRTGVFTYGAFSKEFERRLAEFVGADYCLLCNSGSSANLLAVTALCQKDLKERRLKPGDEVITTALNFPTTINPIIQNGLVPVFVDIELPYYTAKQYNKIYNAGIFTNFLGNITNSIGGSWCIRDNCDAINKDCHTGHISTYSFYPAHHISTGEGGAICTDDPLLYKIMRSLRDWGRDCWCPPNHDNTCGHRFDGEYDHKYTYSHIGYNLQMTEMQAAIGVAQMDKLAGFIVRRKQLFKRYYDGLKDLEDIFILPEATPGSDPAWFGFPLTFRDRNAMDFCRTLEEKYKVHNRRMFAGNILRQPAYKDIRYRVIGNLDNTNLVMDNGFWLWLSPSITDEMADYVIEVAHAELAKR
jgi:CDP-6-deoxy-D-xylo-4-hexulose-3-dehydrase